VICAVTVDHLNEIIMDALNYGICADCNKTVELTKNGSCAKCGSNSTMAHNAVRELDDMIAEKKEKEKNEQ
jgi:rRNA maturation endonuclease Nob1